MVDECPQSIINYFESKAIHALLWIQLLLSLASIAVVVYTVAFKLHRSWFEGVFKARLFIFSRKETLYALYFFILWHSTLLVLLQLIVISARLTAKNACDSQFNKKFCIIRILMTFSFPSFVCLHASITIQRVLTSLSVEGNRKLHLVIARCSLALTLIICVSYTVLGYRDYPLDGIGAFCPGYTKSNTGPLVLVSLFMMIIDLLNVIITFILIRYNRRKIGDISMASLAVKFRHRQTLHSIQQLLPVAFFHLICFTVQYVGYQVGLSMLIPEVDYAVLNGFIYMMPYYCFLSPAILLLLMMIEEKNKKIELRSLSNTTPEATAESYFTSIQSQWEARL